MAAPRFVFAAHAEQRAAVVPMPGTAAPPGVLFVQLTPPQLLLSSVPAIVIRDQRMPLLNAEAPLAPAQPLAGTQSPQLLQVLAPPHVQGTLASPPHVAMSPTRSPEAPAVSPHAPRSSPRPFHCSRPGCQASFTQKSNARRHERLHDGARPYVCNSCGRSFARRQTLQTHSRRHERSRANGAGAKACVPRHTMAVSSTGEGPPAQIGLPASASMTWLVGDGATSVASQLRRAEEGESQTRAQTPPRVHEPRQLAPHAVSLVSFPPAERLGDFAHLAHAHATNDAGELAKPSLEEEHEPSHLAIEAVSQQPVMQPPGDAPQ